MADIRFCYSASLQHHLSQFWSHFAFTFDIWSKVPFFVPSRFRSLFSGCEVSRSEEGLFAQFTFRNSIVLFFGTHYRIVWFIFTLTNCLFETLPACWIRWI